MTQQFTASEARALSKRLKTMIKQGHAGFCEGSMSHASSMALAFAELLEAREKAVPAVWMTPQRNYFGSWEGCTDASNGTPIPLYAHPSPSNAEMGSSHEFGEGIPSPNAREAYWMARAGEWRERAIDAERLAEALRAKIKEWRGAYHHVTEFDRGRRNGFLAACDSLERLLSTHPAQAQPHDLIKTGDADADPSICDVTGEVVLAYCRRCKQGEGDLTDNCPAQPPAASVTDAKDAARYRWLRDKSGRDGMPYIRCDDPPFESMDYWITAGTADSCIDRAMAKENGNG